MPAFNIQTDQKSLKHQQPTETGRRTQPGITFFSESSVETTERFNNSACHFPAREFIIFMIFLAGPSERAEAP